MDRFLIRGYIPFPVEPFAATDAKSGRIVIEIPPGGAVAFEEAQDFPVKADKSDWDLSHPNVVNSNREPYLSNPAGQPYLKTNGRLDAEQGATARLRTFHLDDATPNPNPTEGGPIDFTVVDNVGPSSPVSAFLHNEEEINVPDPAPEPEPPAPEPEPPVEPAPEPIV